MWFLGGDVIVLTHKADEIGEHKLSIMSLAENVFQNTLLTFGSDKVNGDWHLLTEAPRSANSLIELLKRMRREKRLVMAMLPVKAKACNLAFGDKLLNLPFGEG